jgi:hypothetical protein
MLYGYCMALTADEYLASCMRQSSDQTFLAELRGNEALKYLNLLNMIKLVWTMGHFTPHWMWFFILRIESSQKSFMTPSLPNLKWRKPLKILEKTYILWYNILSERAYILTN